MDNAYAVIMAGGLGERFWPLSTSRRPKQMISMFGGKSLMRMAVERLEGFIPVDNILVVTSADHVEGTCDTAPSLKRENVIGEPFGRDTAAAVALGSALVAARDPGATFCVVTADHVIGDIDIFQQTLKDSMRLSLEQEVLITMGIQPVFPSTGFGYIDVGDPIHYDGTTEFSKARRFVEKPDAATAVDYVNAGHFYWNSGMFVWSVSAIQNALNKYAPPLQSMAERMALVVGKPEFNDRLSEEYSQLEKISIDYAIMEKADNIVMAKGKFAWDDVGTWTAIANHFNADDAGNVIIGSCESLDSTSNIVMSEERVTALVGVSDLVVVQAENATLVCSKDHAQEIKKLVALLRDKGHDDLV